MMSAEHPDTMLRSEEAQRLMDETQTAIANTRKFFVQLAEREMTGRAPQFEEHEKGIPEQDK